MNLFRILPKTILACALCAGLISTSALAAKSSSKPNILLIIADDLNDWIGPMKGHPQVKTPNLDKLAARGVTFMNAQCAAPICNPSRTAFMSGMRPSTTGIYNNDQIWMPRVPVGNCINDYLRKQGYTSLAAGKIFHYRNYRPEEWDKVFYVSDDTLPNHPVPNRSPGPFGYRKFTETQTQVPSEEKRAEKDLVDAQTVSWCIDQLGKQTKPFFMACGVHRPHTPWEVPKKYFDMYPDVDKIQLPPIMTNDLSDVPPLAASFAHQSMHQAVLKAGVWKDRVRAYMAAVSYADAQIGRLLDALDASVHKDNTIIVFIGDNGWHLGEKEHWGKSALWRESTRVPLIWVAPGVTKPGTRCEHGVDLMSIYPTLCDLAGVRTPKHAEGTNIKKLLAKPTRKWSIPGICTYLQNNHAMCTAEWRYIRYCDGTEELYKEQADPNDWTNLANKPEFAKVKKELAKYIPKVNVDPAPHRDQAEEGKKAKRLHGKRKARN